jgi:hypothetical protein
MRALLITLAIRLLVCAALAYVLWRWRGESGLVWAALPLALALPRPLIDLVGEFKLLAHRRALAGVQGRHFQHRGIALDIAEDERHHRWIKVSDVRKLIPSLPREAVLREQFPQGLSGDAQTHDERIHADALLAYLEKSTDAVSLKFRHWLRREVVFPATRVRERLGIRDEVPAAGRRSGTADSSWRRAP